jgi:DNA phosphorothioation-associated putative methyltransferase
VTFIRLHRSRHQHHPGKVSYLAYSDFKTDPHPALLLSIKFSLRTRELESFDYAKSTNPPILHHKEAFLPPGHPPVPRFARLTRQEERHGLLDDTATIGTRDGWQQRLAKRGFSVRGHQLIRQQSERDRNAEQEPRNTANSRKEETTSG